MNDECEKISINDLFACKLCKWCRDGVISEKIESKEQFENIMIFHLIELFVSSWDKYKDSQEIRTDSSKRIHNRFRNIFYATISKDIKLYIDNMWIEYEKDNDCLSSLCLSVTKRLFEISNSMGNKELGEEDTFFIENNEEIIYN